MTGDKFYDKSLALLGELKTLLQVSEAMSEWCEGVDSRLWSFHYGLLRQLQTHQEETKTLLSEMTGLAEMRTEVQRLRQENRELRKFFGSNPS